VHIPGGMALAYWSTALTSGLDAVNGT
jgi:hypothetical protein